MTTARISLDQSRASLFTPRQIFGVTLLGTELAGAFLLSKTAHALDAPEVALSAWSRAVCLLVGRIVLIYLFPAAATLVTVFAAVHYFRFAKAMVERSVEEQRDAGGPIASTLSAVGYGLAFLSGWGLLFFAFGS